MRTNSMLLLFTFGYDGVLDDELWLVSPSAGRCEDFVEQNGRQHTVTTAARWQSLELGPPTPSS